MMITLQTNPKVLVIAAAVSELFIGWIPYFVAMQRKAKHRHAIGICGILTALFPLLYVAPLLWSLLGRPEQASGRGFPIEPPEKR